MHAATPRSYPAAVIVLTLIVPLVNSGTCFSPSDTYVNAQKI